MSIFSPETKSMLLNIISSYTYEVSLHSSDPSIAVNPATTEISGGTYGRQGCSLDNDGNSFFNEDAIVFTGLPAVTVTHLGFWYTSGELNSNFALSVPLNSSFNAPSGSSWTISSESVTVNL